MNNKINVKQSTTMLVTIAILTAACVVISMFLTIQTQAVKITLTFLPIAVAAKLYGPVGGGFVAGLSDIIGVICNPLGPWFPPITLTSIVIGVMFGFLFSGKFSFVKILTAVLISEFIFSLFVTPIWLNILYGMDYVSLLITRIPQIIIMTAVKLITIPPMFKALERTKIFSTVPVKKTDKE